MFLPGRRNREVPQGPLQPPSPSVAGFDSALRRLLYLPRAYVRAWRRLRPTREGWVFLASGFAVSLAAVNTGNNLLYLVLATMLSMVALSGFLSELALRGTRVRRQLDEAAFARRVCRGRWCVSRTSGWTPGLALFVEEAQGPHVELDGRVGATVLYLRAGDRREVATSWRFSRRGRHRLRGVRVSTTWPFGIFEKSSEIHQPQDVVVFPEPRSHSVVRSPGTDPGALKEPRSARGGDGGFLGLRNYQRGDDPRRMHWRTSARLGRLVSVDRARSRRAGQVEVWLEQPDQGTLRERHVEFEERLRRATFALCTGIDEGGEARLHLPGGGLAVARDRAGLYRCLEVLATASLDGEAA